MQFQCFTVAAATVLVAGSAAATTVPVGSNPFFVALFSTLEGGHVRANGGNFVQSDDFFNPPTSAQIAANPAAAYTTYVGRSAFGPSSSATQAESWDLTNMISSGPNSLSFVAAPLDIVDETTLFIRSSNVHTVNGQLMEAMFLGRFVVDAGVTVDARFQFVVAEGSVVNDDVTAIGIMNADLDGDWVFDWENARTDQTEAAPRGYRLISERSTGPGGIEVYDMYLRNPSPGAMGLLGIAGFAAIRRRRTVS